MITMWTMKIMLFAVGTALVLHVTRDDDFMCNLLMLSKVKLRNGITNLCITVVTIKDSRMI